MCSRWYQRFFVFLLKQDQKKHHTRKRPRTNTHGGGHETETGGVSAHPPTDISLCFVDVSSSCSKVFLSLVMCARIDVCTSKKRFQWGPHDVCSDYLHGVTVLSLSVAFPMLGSI